MGGELLLTYESLEALSRAYDSDLRKGRAFVVGATGPGEREPCVVVLVHPTTGARHAAPAEVVWVKRDAPGAGVGVALRDFDDAARAALQAFITSPPPAEAADEGDASGERAARNIHDRVRGLTMRERETMARQGTLPERVALERCFGSSVWEGLLQNPQLTPPEVARIAKNGTLPRPLVGLLVGNAAWLAQGEIQRALLGNPRVGGAHLDRVLRALTRPELERVPSMTHHRHEVRQAARRLLGIA